MIKHIYSINDLPPDQTNLAKIRKISDRQIAKAAREDEDVPLLTKEELAQFKLVDIQKRNLYRKS